MIARPNRKETALALTEGQRLGNLEKKSQIATGESRSSAASGMACPPLCTEYNKTTGVPSFTQVMLSTEMLPPLCGSFASSGMAVTPNSFAQYFAVSSLESTLPSAPSQRAAALPASLSNSLVSTSLTAIIAAAIEAVCEEPPASVPDGSEVSPYSNETLSYAMPSRSAAC